MSEDSGSKPTPSAAARREVVRCIVEVSAGVIPGTANPEYTKQYVITSEQWEEAGPEQGLLLLETYARAMAYSMSVLDPSQVNWTQVNWIWM